MQEQKNLLTPNSLLKSIKEKTGATVLNMFSEDFRKELITNILLNSLETPDKAVLVFSSNQTKEALIKSLLFTKAGFSPEKKDLSDVEWNNLAKSMNKLAKSLIYISDENKTTEDIILTISDFKQKNQAELNFILIDSLNKTLLNENINYTENNLNSFAKKNDLSLVILN